MRNKIKKRDKMSSLSLYLVDCETGWSILFSHLNVTIEMAGAVLTLTLASRVKESPVAGPEGGPVEGPVGGPVGEEGWSAMRIPSPRGVPMPELPEWPAVLLAGCRLELWEDMPLPFSMPPSVWLLVTVLDGTGPASK